MSALMVDDEVLERDIDSLVSDIELGFDFLESAGQKLVKMKEKHGDFVEAVRHRNDWITVEMLLTIEAIGRKQLHPRLLLAPKFTLSAFATLPYEEQKYAVENPIAVKTREGTVHRRITDMTRDEVRQVVDPLRGVRKPREQKLSEKAVKLGKFFIILENGQLVTKPADKIVPGVKVQRVTVDVASAAIIEIVAA